MSSIHLLVLIHGMWGHPGHLAEAARIVKEIKSQPSPDRVALHVLLAETNRDEHTYDGIDWGGERVAQEVMDETEKLKADGKEVVRFSVLGYSLGGLISRYLIGILHQRGFFDKVTPVNFNTIATPHIGLLRYPTFLSSIFSAFGPRLLSRTGEQFYCVDKWSATGRPLLQVMADPDRIFYQALTRFEHIRIYANAINDRTVPYPTAAIETFDPFAERSKNGLQVNLDKQYKPLIKSFELPSSPPPPPRKPIFLSRAWFKSLRFSKPFLPPLLRFRVFPLNILIYLLLPLLIPLFIMLVIIRLSMASRSSRNRIKLMETDPSTRDRLAHVFAQLERRVEDTIADIIDQPGSDTDTDAAESPKPGSDAYGQGGSTRRRHPSSQPKLSPVQAWMATSLNKLPLKKERAFIQGVVNSHAVIVCRDVKQFELHRVGEGVLRHWADAFLL